MSTGAASTAALRLNEDELSDVERRLDVTRGEALFARGIVFVEGEAEEDLVPLLAKLLGYDLDELGVSVCSAAGTRFLPYVKFFGPNGLGIPLAVMTDSDPGTKNHGLRRVRKPLKYLCPDDEAEIGEEGDPVPLANGHGLFLANHTFEVALFRCGRRFTYRQTVSELGTGSAKRRASDWESDPKLFEPLEMLKDIDGIGKGRFAQRWAYHVARSRKGKKCCQASI